MYNKPENPDNHKKSVLMWHFILWKDTPARTGNISTPGSIPFRVIPASSGLEQTRCCSGCVPRWIEQLVIISGATDIR